jgi:hypothetical protein
VGDEPLLVASVPACNSARSGPRAVPSSAQDADEPIPPNRRQTMILQALFLAAFWPGIYVLREQSRAISASIKREEAERKRLEAEAQARRRFEGKWQSARGDGLLLELWGRRFTFSRDGTDLILGDFFRSDQDLTLARLSSSGYCAIWKFHYRATTEELTLWGEADFEWVVLLRLLGRKVTAALQEEDKVLRFKRVKE